MLVMIVDTIIFKTCSYVFTTVGVGANKIIQFVLLFHMDLVDCFLKY